MPPPDAPNPGPTVLSRERLPIRTREAKVTLSAWRVELQLPNGDRGAIVHSEPFYRAEGALLGASQQRLAELWKALLPETPEEQPPPQWG